MTSTNASDTLRNASNLLQQTVSTFANLIEQSANLSFDLLNSFTSTTPTLDLSGMKLPALLTPSSCGCKIPPPCWMPRSAGCVVEPRLSRIAGDFADPGYKLRPHGTYD